MELRDVLDLLVRHRRCRWWPWRCRCGLHWPCGARLVAEDERTRLNARAAQEFYAQYFARRRP